MLEPLHINEGRKQELIEYEQQGFTVLTCNNWLCPFNNDGYCVSPMWGDECIWDKEFESLLDRVYDERIPDEEREATRRLMIEKWGGNG